MVGVDCGRAEKAIRELYKPYFMDSMPPCSARGRRDENHKSSQSLQTHILQDYGGIFEPISNKEAEGNARDMGVLGFKSVIWAVKGGFDV